MPNGMYGGGVLCKAASKMKEGPSTRIGQENLSNDLMLLQLRAVVSER